MFFYELILILILVKICFALTNGECRSNVNLRGKTALVTGGSSGIGYRTVLGLAARGCRVIVASRNCNEELKQKVIKHTNNEDIVIKNFDLGSLASIRKLAEELQKEEEKIDILINNAGTLGLGNNISKDGMDLTMQINHFGPFLLTHLLVGLLKKSDSARVLFVSSMMSFVSSVNMETLNNPYGSREAKSTLMGDMKAYCNSKACNIIAANAFAEKLRKFRIDVNSLHPGHVNTPIHLRYMLSYRSEKFIKAFYAICGMFLKTPHQGAQTTLHLATSQKRKGTTGKHFWDCVQFPFQPAVAKDATMCQGIWAKSEELVGLASTEKL